ncbi:hypothetical protein AWJ20_2956 [Sugiyamaella lignohabitans]|uniref:RNB domain-containing protein n=1 Tax=Sugiyamaella lignohabitans TaxID=796027 RepID=A0A167FI52_9ASCO|nr:uncharacterized protein AWJ20_2956 [Sugiyamaella lignohabitans]ANB15329.1 hypothetical protein AWJ20_2956 [Sugiyamaella lignohabitans]
MSPDAEITFESDGDDNSEGSNEFIRFNPLPSRGIKARHQRKLSTQDLLDGHKLSMDQIYTGRPKNTIPSLAYYSEISETNGFDLEPSTDAGQKLFKQIESEAVINRSIGSVSVTSFIGSECYRTDVLPGDMVEVCSRDGHTTFGMILAVDDSATMADVLSVDGAYFRLSLKCSSHSLSSKLTLILRGLITPSKLSQYTSIPESKDIYMHFMNIVIKDALALVPLLSPYLQPVYAYLAQPDTLQATNLEYITRNMISASRNALERKVNPSPISQISLRLATYLSACGNNLRFARLSVDSPVVAVSERAFDAIVKIMHYLTDQELSSYINAFKELLLTPVKPNLSQHTDSMPTPSGLSPIITFLQSYVISPDPRLSDAVRSILSKLYRERDSEIWLSSPSSVHKLLSEAGASVKDEPFSVKGGLAWSSDSKQNDLHKIFERQFKKHRRPKGFFENRITWEKLPVYRLGGEKDIGFSLEKTSAGTFKFFIHFPDFTSVLQQDEPAVKTLMKIGKSWIAPFGVQSLFPKTFVDAFREDCLTKSWTVSVNIPSLDADLLEHTSCEVTQTYIPKKLQTDVHLPSDDGLIVTSDIVRDHNHGLSREHVLRIRSICSLLENTFWSRINNGSVFDFPMSSRSYYPVEIDSSQSKLDFTLRDIIRESRILTGILVGNFGALNQLPLPYLRQGRGQTGEMHRYCKERRSKGSISTSDRILAESFLTNERISKFPGPYAGLGIADAYVHIGSPFEDTLSLYSQWVLREHLQRKNMVTNNDDEAVLNRNLLRNKEISSAYMESQIYAQRDLVTYFYEKLKRYNALRRLEDELRVSNNYYIFRCEIVEDAQFPDMAIAYCHDLNLLVDVVLYPDSSVSSGDTVLCTEIIELTPVDGLLVLGL